LDGDGYRLLKARLCELLDLLRMGVVFERASGDRLWYVQNGREVEILDLVGGYGALLLGHHHPEIVAEAQRALATGRPIHAQGSRRGPAGELARVLDRRTGGGFRVVLTNSGAEAVDAAMKHAMLETGGRTFVALERGFHGKTLGALQLTANPDYREPFELAGLRVLRVRPDDGSQLERAFAEATDLAGFVFEPIQGEGGVRPLSAEFVGRAAELCAARNVPLIADEIQTGMGRTGTFLACEALGVRPDYVLLSKALGGGIAKVAALLIRSERYVPDFDRLHTSTYAEDDFSSLVALKTLELLGEEALATCRRKGERLLEALRSIGAKYPDVIADVRGRGLFAGLEFRPQTASRSFIVRMLSAKEDLVPVLSGYLFNVHRLRLLPTMSDPFTLRFEPSLLLSDEDLDRVRAALEDVCSRLRHGDSVGLTGYFLRADASSRHDEPESSEEFVVFDEPAFRAADVAPEPIRLGWIFHLVDANDLTSLERPFADLSQAKRESYLRHLASQAVPVVMNCTDIRSATGQAVRLHAILLPFTSKQMKRWIDERRLHKPMVAVENGIEAARRLGCKLVALGQYTSIVTRNGLKVRDCGLGVTTGNSYALTLALEALAQAQHEADRSPGDSVLGVLGAAGNIGRACAEILAPHYRRTILVGSDKPGSRLRLDEVARTLPNAEVATDPAALRAADVVMAAVNAVDMPLSSTHFARNAIVCDLSVPTAIHPSLRGERPDVLVIRGGIAQLPRAEDLGIIGFHLPPGQTYGCMAEGLLLGYEGVFDTTFTGAITAGHVRRVTGLARKHGFRLAEYKTRCVLGSEPAEESHVLSL